MNGRLFTASVMFWMNITFAILCAVFDNFIQATVFLAAAGSFFAAELVIKEMRDLKND